MRYSSEYVPSLKVPVENSPYSHSKDYGLHGVSQLSTEPPMPQFDHHNFQKDTPHQQRHQKRNLHWFCGVFGGVALLLMLGFAMSAGAEVIAERSHNPEISSASTVVEPLVTEEVVEVDSVGSIEMESGDILLLEPFYVKIETD